MSHNRKRNRQIIRRQELAVTQEMDEGNNPTGKMLHITSDDVRECTKKQGIINEQNASSKMIHKQMVYAHTDLKRGLPKNIRQIGEPQKSPRIYVEDYVVTYLNQLAHPTNAISRGAILLGNWQDMDGEQVLFISGAVEAENLSFDLKEIEFTNETWTELYEKIQCYFEDVEVVGWFLSRLGYSIRLTDTMLKLHRKYFPKEGSVLYLLDALEQEDAFFVQENEQLIKQGGYYIYYERNAQMQNYLIENQAIERHSPAQKRIAYKDEQLLHSYHEIMAARASQKEHKRVAARLYVASALFVVVVLAVGINIFNSYDKLKSMQSSLDQMILQQKNAQSGQDTLNPNESKKVATSEPTSTNRAMGSQAETGVTEEAASQTSNTVASVSAIGNQEGKESDDSTDSSVDLGKQENPQKTSDEQLNSDVRMQDATPAASMGRSGDYYVVKKGDTLLSISKDIYHSESYVELIRNANGLEEDDYIYAGQQIVLPSIQ